MNIYVLTAWEDGQQKECFCVEDDALAAILFTALATIYGAKNVCMASRQVGIVPDSIMKFVTTAISRASFIK